MVISVERDPVYPNAKTATSFQDGMEFQDFVCTELARFGIVLQNLMSRKWQFTVGENLQGFEIKLDEPCTRTSRLSIEIAEKSRNDMLLDWTPSGIYRSDNSWLYIQGNSEVLFVFAKNWLVRYFERAKPEVTAKFGTIQTFYLPFDLAKQYAARVIDLKAK